MWAYPACSLPEDGDNFKKSTATLGLAHPLGDDVCFGTYKALSCVVCCHSNGLVIVVLVLSR